MAQVQVLLAELDRHSHVVDSTGNKTYLPVILTGDFNLKPYSAPFNLITKGEYAVNNDFLIKICYLSLGSLKYEHLTPKTLIHNSNGNLVTGRQLLPIKLGISDECQHYKSEIKVSSFSFCIPANQSYILYHFAAISFRTKKSYSV